MLSGLSGGSLAFLAVFRLERSVNNQQIDLACIHIHPTYLHNHPISQLITDTGPFSTQLVTDFVEMVIVIAQIGNMYQSFDTQTDAQGKIGRQQKDKCGRSGLGSAWIALFSQRKKS